MFVTFAIKSNCMKNLLILIACFSGWYTAIAQTETTTINGKSYYVYPYQEEVEMNYAIFYAGVTFQEKHQRDSLNRKVISTEIEPLEEVVPIESLYEFNPSAKKTKKLILKLRSEYPGIFVSARFPLDRDITPTLEPLPDGLYVQYYRDLPYVDANNILRFRNDIPCAYFHLKDNRLHGFAYWVNPMGDTLKAGTFTNGIKNGRWVKYTYSSFPATELLNKKPALFEKYVDHSYFDTSFVRVEFKNGLMEGTYEAGYNDFVREKGHYKNNKPSGEWFEYAMNYYKETEKGPWKTEVYLEKHYFLADENQQKNPVKGRIIRNSILDNSRFEYKKELVFNRYIGHFAQHYDLYIPENETDSYEGLELPEEQNHSYPGEEYDDYEDYMYYGDFEEEEENLDYIDFAYEDPDRVYYVNKKYYSRNGLLDSLGYVARYATVYEEFYPGNQVKIRYTIENGRIIEPDTIYWSNGNPANVISQNKVTGAWKEEVFDMNKVSLYVNEYDSLGNLTTILDDDYEDESIVIRGKEYEFNNYMKFFIHHGEDSLYHPITNKQTLYEALWPRDSSVAISKIFDPQSRVLEEKHFALNRDLVYHLDCEFSEDYSSVNAKEICESGKLRTETLLSGSYEDNYQYFRWMQQENDSILTGRVDNWKYNYFLSSDFTLYYNNQPFTGKFTLTSNVPDFNLEVTPNSIHLDYATGEKHEQALKKANKKYWKHKKVTNEAHYMSMPTYYRNEISSLVLNVLPFADQLFEPVYEDHFIEDDYDYFDYEYGYESGKKPKEKKLTEQQAEAFDKFVEGQFLNGKPEGTWKTVDQFGNPSVIMHFKNGQLNGPVEQYKTVYPPKKNTMEALMRYNPAEMLRNGPVPNEPTHYLARLMHYKNGLLDGTYYEFKWNGDTSEYANYSEGRLEGEAFFKSGITYTQARFEGGAPDGIIRSYLTLPKKAPVLLFDLNYQNGLLQGESKSYHLNGKLAKHGFFLTGQPIDDFEAFDTLGFKYQYVKFLYNQPVEEKIWEENQLSVRYEFDWKDSIPFDSEAITRTDGLERLVYEMSGGGRAEPYYGRPSTVDKTGINYKMTKYYPNDSIARRGTITAGKKTGFWESWNYEGKKLYEVQYFDSIMAINDSVRFKSKGILTLLDTNGRAICKSYIVEKVEKYDCSHTDHHEVRMFRTFWERDTSMHRINGYVKNYYDNGVLMNEGNMKDGLATGVWKFYDPYGNLNMVGEYVLGKRNGRWLSGDLSQVKYMGDICLNPNLPNLDEILSYEEKLLDISVIYYQMTKVISREYYGVDMNADGPPEGYEGEEMYYEEEYYEED